MKILIVGHRSMLAQELLPCLQQAGFEVVGYGRPTLDITQPQSIRAVFETAQPHLVINTAAYTAVDAAEAEATTAFAMNRDGAAYLAEACQAHRLPCIHLSTDYVFDGTATHPYDEEAPTHPLSVYGQSKQAGEVAVRTALPQHLIVRTSWLYGKQGSNFVKTMLRLGRERELLRVVNDQHGCPTWTRALSEVLTGMCQRLQQDPSFASWGTYHVCNAGQTTWYHFAQAIFELARPRTALKVQKVEPIPTAEYPTPAQRPAHSVLDCRKLGTVFGIFPPPWHESLRLCLQEWEL